jgi:hypothetical protein
MRLSSRRDQMMVAWHEMPGKQAGRVRPVGNGMIRRFRPYPSPKTIERPIQPNHTVLSGTGFPVSPYQAFYAWLPSFGPSGTSQLGHDGYLAERKVSNTPILRHSARQNSRTTTSTRTSTRRRTPNAKRQTPNA